MWPASSPIGTRPFSPLNTLDLKCASTCTMPDQAPEINQMKPTQAVIDAAYAQFGRPTGLLGRAAGVLMAHRSSNRKRTAWAVSLRGVRPNDRVLEVGCGPGLAVRELSRIANAGYVCGLDHSEVMLRQARRRNADGVRRGNVELRLG